MGNCVDCNKCNKDCGCKTEIDANCVKYKGENTMCLDIVKGDRLENIVPKLDKSFCLMKSTLDNFVAPAGPAGPAGAPGVDGAAGPVGPEGPAAKVGIRYQAWADDASGAGFTLTPSNKLFTAIVSTIVGNTPVLTDFAGSFYQINQPVKEFKSGKKLPSTAIHPTTPGLVENLVSPIILPTIPKIFLDSITSFGEIEIVWQLTTDTAPPTYFTIGINVNGQTMFSGALCVAGITIPHILIKTKLNIHKTSATHHGTLATSTIHAGTSATTVSQGVVGSSAYLPAIPIPTTGLPIKIESFYTDATDVDLIFSSYTVKAYDPDKTTM